MAHPAPLNTARATPTDFVEMSLGRQNWTYADYIAEGIRQCEAGETVRPIPQHLRAEYARSFAEMSMPHAKLAAHRAAQRAAIYAEFGEPPVDQSQFVGAGL